MYFFINKSSNTVGRTSKYPLVFHERCMIQFTYIALLFKTYQMITGGFMDKRLIIGSGVIGTTLFNEMVAQEYDVYLASRSLQTKDNQIQLDALDADDVLEKTKGFSIIYICIGLPYKEKVWVTEWPVIMNNIITAAEKNKYKIVFFDNVYMYGKFSNPCTETHEYQPVSNMGKSRKLIAEMLEQNTKDVTYLIARSPDFFGPNAKNSVLYSAFIENILKQKDPFFIGLKSKKHSYGYTEDLVRSMLLLSNETDTYNQVWHLPSHQTNSIDDVLNLINTELHQNYQIKLMSKRSVTLLSLFIPMLKEVGKMRYQFDNDYVLDFSKFQAKFPDFKLTPLDIAIKNTINSFKA